VLREYQQDLMAGIHREWAAGHQRVAGVMATGGGKTWLFAHMAAQAHENGRPTLVLAHRTELIDQAIEKLQRANPTAQIGRMQGPLKQWRSDIVVGSVQTCSRPAALKLIAARRWGLVVCDEVHHVAAQSYQTVLQAAGCFRPGGPKFLGVTATLDRSDGLSLGDTIEAVAEPRIGLIELIKGGWLVRPRGIRVKIRDLDLDGVRKVAGELNQGQLGAAMHAAMAPQKLVEAWIEHAKGRQTIAFMPTVAVSQEVAEAFKAAGHRFEHLSDKTPKRERAALLQAYRRGEVLGLCNVGLFTEGTDLERHPVPADGRPRSAPARSGRVRVPGAAVHLPA
jgi:superfamily II DNA or RNA helicase